MQQRSRYATAEACAETESESRYFPFVDNDTAKHLPTAFAVAARSTAVAILEDFIVNAMAYGKDLMFALSFYEELS